MGHFVELHTHIFNNYLNSSKQTTTFKMKNIFFLNLKHTTHNINHTTSNGVRREKKYLSKLVVWPPFSIGKHNRDNVWCDIATTWMLRINCWGVHSCMTVIFSIGKMPTPIYVLKG